MRNKNKYVLTLLIVLGVLVAGCTDQKQTTPVTPTQKAPTDTQTAPETKAIEKGTENDKMTDQDAQKMVT